MNFLSRCLGVLVLCVLFLSLAAPSHAQTASTTEGAIVGTVTDTSGSAVAGATINLSGSQVMGTKTATTDPNGVYRFPALNPGDYQIKYEAPGFGTQTREGVHISLGFTATVNVQMSVGAVTESITVEGETSNIDLQSNNITTNLEDEQLKTLPGSRDLWAVLAQAPAIAETKMDVGGSDALTQQPYTVYGLGTSGVGGGGINRGEVEGMMVNEGSGGGGSEMFYADYGAMQTISVNAANNSAEMPQPGVLSQMIVKSGGNDFHGDAYFDYENGAMEGHNIDAAELAALTAGGVKPSPTVALVDTNRLNLFRDVAADIGGYLKKDKLWWFFAYRYTATSQNYPTLNESQKSTSPNYTTKVTYNLTPKQKIVGFYTHSNKLQPDYLNALVLSGGRQAGALESASTTWNSSYPVYVWNLQYTYAINSSLVFEAMGGNYFSGWTRLGKSDLARIEDTTTNFVSGGLQNTENDRHRQQGRGSISYIHSGWLGTHNFKFGAEYMRDINHIPWGGLGIPGDLEATVPCPSAIPGAVLGANCQAVTTLNAGAPNNVYFYAAPSYEVRNGNSTVGIYANDTWQPSRRLTINVGLRFDRQNIFSLADTGPNGQAFPAANYVVFHDFGPRVGLSYDISGHGTSVVKVSFGHYFNYPAADYGSALNPDAAGWFYEYQWRPTALQLNGRAGDTATNFYLPGDNLGSFVASQGGVATTSFAPNLKLANTYQASAYLEQQLGGFTLRTGFVYNNLIDIAGSVNVDRPLAAYNQAKTFYVPDATNTISNSSPTVTVWDLDPAVPSSAVLNQFGNLPENSHYYNWEFTALKRSRAGHFTLMGSFNYTWNYVRNFSGGFGTGSSFTPNQLINTVDCADTTAPCTTTGMAEYYNWQGKINSTVTLPLGFKVTPILRLQSGIPFGRTFSTSTAFAKAPGTTIAEPSGAQALRLTYTILAEPFGAERTPTMALFDVRTEKEFHIKERFVATGFVDLYNIFNTNSVQAVTAASGTSFLAPSNITPPRILRLGVKFQF
jgi:hypothetical protein